MIFGSYDLWTLSGQDLAFCLVENGQRDDAKRLFDDARKRLGEKLGKNHLDVRECEEKRIVFLGKLEACFEAEKRETCGQTTVGDIGSG